MKCRSAHLAARLFLCCLTLTGPLWAQNENETVGFQTNHLFESGHFGENIDILNGGLNLTIPIGPRYQVSRYLGYQLQLSYGSKIWDHTPPEQQPDKLFRRSNMGLGFNMHFGRIYKDTERADGGNTSCVWYYVSPDGNEHEIALAESGDPCWELPTAGFTIDNTYYHIDGWSGVEDWGGRPAPVTSPVPVLRMTTSDGRRVYEFSHMVQTFDADNQPMNREALTVPYASAVDTNYNRDFGGWYVTKIYDYTSRDGTHPYGRHYVSIEYDLRGVAPELADTIEFSHAIKTIRDSLGRQIEFTISCEPGTGSGDGGMSCKEDAIPNNDPERASVRTTMISVPAFKASTIIEDPITTSATYTFGYAWRKVNHFDAADVCRNSQPPLSPTNCPQTSVNVLTEIGYPQFDNHAGTQAGYTMGFDYGDYDDLHPLKNGQVHRRILPTGAEISYSWGVYYYLFGNTLHLERKDLRMTPGGASSGSWTYTRQAVEQGTIFTNPKYVTVTDPVGNETVHYYRASAPSPHPPPLVTDFEDGYAPEWDDGVTWRVEYYEGNGPTRQLIRVENRDYDADQSIWYFPKRFKRNVRLTRQVTTYADDGAKQSIVEYRDWNNRGLWREKIESGDGIQGTRRTRTEYRINNGDASVVDYQEVSDGLGVLSRTDNDYDLNNNLVLSIQRLTLPTAVGTARSVAMQAGNVVTVYTYDADSNVVRKETSNQGASLVGGEWQFTSAPKYRIRYGYQPGGYLVSKEFYNFDPAVNAYFPWKAIDWSRDGHTGLIFKVRDPSYIPGSNEIETSYAYDALGRLKDITPSSTELPTAIEYRSATGTSVRQGPGDTYQCDVSSTRDFVMGCYAYDTLGRLVKTQKRSYDPNASPSQTTDYDVLGRVKFQSEWIWPNENPCAPNPLSSCGTTYDYGDPATLGQGGFRPSDPFGRPRSVISADNQVTETAYFGQSSLVTVKGIKRVDGTSFDAITRYTRDVWGRLVEVVPPVSGGAKATYGYDRRDNLIQVDLMDPVTLVAQSRSFEFDALSRLRASFNPESGAEVITSYDVLGNAAATTGSSGNHTFFTYDGAARLLRVEWQEYQKPGASVPPTRTLQENSYDGNPAQFGASRGRLTSTRSYDDAGALLHTRELYYQELNGRLSKERNFFIGSTPNVTALDAAIQYRYNTFGLLAEQVYPEGATGMGGAYSAKFNYVNGYIAEAWNGQVCQVPVPSDPPGQSCPRCLAGQPCTPQARVTYNAAGGFREIQTPGNRKTEILPDRRNRPKQIRVGNLDFSETLYNSGSYEYDGAGNIYQMGLNRYGYDGANRLIQANDVDDVGTIREQTFLYDGFGNMTQKILRVNGVEPPALEDVYTMANPNTNRLQTHRSGSTTYLAEYDARGNITVLDGKVYEADSRNRMLSVRKLASADTEIARYSYDASANRVRTNNRQRDLWTFYVRDGQSRLLSEFRLTQRGTYTPEWVKHYLYLGGRLVGLRENQIPGPPAGLRATSSVTPSSGFITLYWSANPAGEGVSVTNYNVYRSLNVTPPSWELRTTTTNLSYKDTVAKHTWYRYVLTAVDATGRESYGTDPLVVWASTSYPVPSAPIELVANGWDRRVSLTWSAHPNASTQNVVGYHVYRETNVPDWRRLTQNPVVQTSFVDQGYSDGFPLTNGTTYRFYVSAVNSSGMESTANPEASATPNDFTPPGPPLGLKAIPACDATSHVLLSWKLNVAADQASYTLYRDPPFPVGPSLPPSSATSYTDEATADNFEYTYWVRAVDAGQNVSEESLHVKVRTRAPGAVAAPRRPVAQSGDGLVKLRTFWEPGILSMRLYRKRNVDIGCENYEVIQTRTPGSVDFTDGTVANNLAWDYVVTNVNANGESAFSKPALALPVQAPSAFRQCAQNLGTGVSNWKDGAGKCLTGDAHPFRRLLLRWESPSAPKYQPLTASNADGTLGYLLGYRVYRHAVPVIGTDRDATSLVPLRVDDQKSHCQNHPDISCWDDTNCPSGDTCLDLFETQNQDWGFCEDTIDDHCLYDSQCGFGDYGIGKRCLGRKVGICPSGSHCFVHSDCPTGGCRPGPIRDPYLTAYQDDGVNTYWEWKPAAWVGVPYYYGGACLTATAVYRIFADGIWRLVESGYADNFDVADQNPLSRCVEVTPDLCEVREDGHFADTHYPCAPDGTLPPTPGAPTVSTPAAGKIKLEWDPPAACVPSPPVECGIYLPACPTNQYCDFSAPDGISGFCKFKNPVFCSEGTVPVPCQGTGVACESRESEVAGYYIYAGEKDKETHHFKAGSPVAWTSGARTHTFEGLAPYISGATPNQFSFRIASFDRGGRISNLSPASGLIAPQDPGQTTPPAPPGSVKTAVWSGTYTLIKWIPGANYAGLTGYRVWRSTSEAGPYCALMYSAPNWVCRNAASLAPTDQTTIGTSFSDGVTPGVIHYYKVTAMTAAGESAPSAIVAGLALPPRESQRLRPPESFTAEAPLGTEILGVPEWAGIYLRWCHNRFSEGVTGYNVYRSRNSMDPFGNLIATIPPVCLDGRTRCEIRLDGEVFQTNSCQSGAVGNCAIVDTTVTQATANVPQIYYYYVSAERDLGGGVKEESAFSNENQGRPNCQDCRISYTQTPTHGWAPVFDPDNFPERICGDEFAALRDQGPAMAGNESAREPDGAVEQVAEQAPYRVIGQAVGPPTPNAAPRFVYLHLDHLGSPRVVTDATGALISKHHYMPFGEEMPGVAQGSANKRQFTGHERDDETGLDYMLARYYGSSLGRFLSPDLKSGYLLLPQTLNRYIYAANNPLRFVDPNGLDFYLFCLGESETCHNNKVGKYTYDEDGNKTFEETVVFEKDGQLQDKEGNKYNAEVNADGVHLSKQGSDKSYYGKWQKGSNSVSFTQQSGFLAGFEFMFGPQNPHWGQDARGTFTYRGTLAAAQAALEAAGFDSVFGIQPGDDFKSSGGPDRSNATHFIIKSGDSVPVTGTLHTGESRGLKHVPEAIVNVYEVLTRQHLGGTP